MSKVLRFGLLVLLSILYPTTESKSAFQRDTENDVKFHKPPSKNHVPLAYQKIGAVVASHIDGHLHISLPIKPFNDSIAMEEKHYEEGKKRLSISLDTYQLMDKCQNVKISNLKNDVKRISESIFVIYSMEESTIEIICLTPGKPREVRNEPIHGLMKVSIDQNCQGNFNG